MHTYLCSLSTFISAEAPAAAGNGHGVCFGVGGYKGNVCAYPTKSGCASEYVEDVEQRQCSDVGCRSMRFQCVGPQKDVLWRGRGKALMSACAPSLLAAPAEPRFARAAQTPKATRSWHQPLPSHIFYIGGLKRCVKRRPGLFKGTALDKCTTEYLTNTTNEFSCRLELPSSIKITSFTLFLVSIRTETSKTSHLHSRSR